jgi:hypothetical protein
MRNRKRNEAKRRGVSHGQPIWIYHEIIKPIFCINYNIFRHVGSLYLRLKDETANHHHLLLLVPWLKLISPFAALRTVIIVARSPYLCLQSEVMTFVLLVRRVYLIYLLMIRYIIYVIFLPPILENLICAAWIYFFSVIIMVCNYDPYIGHALPFYYSIVCSSSCLCMIYYLTFFRSCFETS